MLTAKDVFEQLQTAAIQATGPDERALQVDYPALEQRLHEALGQRMIALIHINQFLPEGYEDQGRLNCLVLTQGQVLFDIVIGDQYFRYDIFSARDLDKIQLIDAVWENREKRQEEPFLSLRLMHGDEAHILLALDDEQRKSVLAFTAAVAGQRHPERTS